MKKSHKLSKNLAERTHFWHYTILSRGNFQVAPQHVGNFAFRTQAWWPIGSTCTWTRVIANSLRFCQSLARTQMAVPKSWLMPNGAVQFWLSHIIIERWNRLWTFFLQFYITPEPQCHTIRNHIWNLIYVMHPFHWKLTWHRTWLGT